MGKAKITILEGEWWNKREVPPILFYFHALSISHPEINVSHKTIRSVEDIAYYVKRIPKGSGEMVYFACHGEALHLMPARRRDKINQIELLDALNEAKTGAISFVHFGCCEMVDPKLRRDTHEKILDATGAKWASGYTTSVDWLQSTLLDLALVTEVFVPYCASPDGRVTKPKKTAQAFVDSYKQLARALGFSALSQFADGMKLFPERLHS